MGLWETFWGKISETTMGSFQVFAEIVTLTCVVQVKVSISPKTSICIFSFLVVYSSSEDIYGKPVSSYDMEYHASSCFQANLFHIMDFYLDFHRFLLISIRLHGFPTIFLDFHGLSLIYMDFNRIS
jgi:hypothetical protein